MLSKHLQSRNHSSIESVLLQAGYAKAIKITETLQGSIWRSLQQSSNKHVVIKVTDINLHENHMVIYKGDKVKVHENILIESCILKYLSKDKECPDSIIKYMDSFKSNICYFVVMEDGGMSLFDFIVKIHELIKIGRLEIAEWHKMVKIIFKQMIECINYIHSKNICHFDISLENFVINDVNICVETTKSVSFHEFDEKLYDEKIRFNVDDKHRVQVKLCDFGLAQYFANISSSDCNYYNEGVVKLNKFQSNKYCGKTNYKSPENINKKKYFDAKKNDIWGLGVSLFMIICGIAPWKKACKSDPAFNIIINGGILYLLSEWNKIHYVNKHLMELFCGFFKYENERININTLNKCSWLNQ